MNRRLLFRKKLNETISFDFNTINYNLPIVKKINTIYFTGSSFTEGGGLNEATLDSYRNKYKIKFIGNKERDVCYPTLVGKQLKIEIINEAQCGGGFDRLIRKIWEYIPTQPMYKLKKTLFILELPGAYNRLDIYSNKLNTHLICNISHTENYNDFNIFVTENYLKKQTLDDVYFTQITNSIKNWYIDCVNPVQQTINSKNSLSGLISFFKLNDIPFLLSGQLDFIDYGLFENIEKNILFLEIDKKEYDSILRYSNDNNKRISDEINNSTDDHPGLFAHQKWADGIIDFLNNKYL
jgi:hypothetical protein